MINKDMPAFPCQPLDSSGNPITEFCVGISIRAWLAGQALAATADRDVPMTEIAEDAVRIADAVIAELNKEPLNQKE